LNKLALLTGTETFCTRKPPSFYLTRGYRDPTVPITQYNGPCHVTLYHTYPLGVNRQVARTFQETRNWGLPSHINPPPAKTKRRGARVFTPCSPASSHLARSRLHNLLARVFTPYSPASSHLARPRLHTLLASVLTPCSPASAHLARPRLHTSLASIFTPCSPASSHLARPRLDTLLVHDEQKHPAHAPLNGRPSALEVIAPVSLSYMFTCTDVARPRLRRPLMLRTSQATMADDTVRIP
jgi:hypothetical protein